MHTTNKKFAPALLTTTMILMAGSAEASSFSGLGFLEGGTKTLGTNISGDGSTVIGWGNNATTGASEAFYWTADSGITPLGYLANNTTTSYANAVSRDGSAIVGMSANTSGTWQAYKWTPSTGIVQLPGLVAGFSRANAVSADGSIVVGGTANAAGFYSPTLWNNGVVQDLGYISGGVNNGFGWGVSTDGRYVAGNSTTADGDSQGIIWSQETGLVATGFTTGITSSSLSSISDTGLAAGNVTYNGVMTEALWSQAGGYQILGTLPGNVRSSATRISADGKTVLGFSLSATNSFTSSIWDQTHGLRDLKTALLDDYALDTGSWVLSYASGISEDGLVISGYGIDPNGQTQAWVANLRSPAAVPVPGAVWLFGTALAGMLANYRRKQ